MNTLLKFSLVLATAALTSVASLWAQEAEDYYDYAPAKDEYATTGSSATNFSFAIKGFYALALEDEPVEGLDGDSFDLVGITTDFMWTPDVKNVVLPELLLSVGFGAGQHEIDGGWYYQDADVYVYSWNFLLGVNFRVYLNDDISFYLGPRLGGNLLLISTEWEGGSKENEDDFAFLYGGEIGANFNVNPNSAVMFSVSYLGSNAQPYSDIEKQSYIMFSVGYRHTF